jgi:serine/threonine protein kinase/Flp pilus assembly protein TadD
MVSRPAAIPSMMPMDAGWIAEVICNDVITERRIFFMIGNQISHYKIFEKLGEGGMGVVYKAHDTKLDRTVALKFLPSGYSSDEEEKKRFLLEARAASGLDHPNICTIYEIGEADGKLFIVMGYYDGETLKRRLSYGVQEPKEALKLSRGIAEGLARAHTQGIIHRDIKPANIIVTKENTPKILDFGLAKLSGQTLMTKAGTTLGTAAYMSPEQARGEKTDFRTDIWSFGCVLYEMLTGEIPFRGEHEAAMMYRIVNEEAPPPSGLDKRIPRQIDQLVLKMLEKDPMRRYQSMNEVVNTISETLEAMETLAAQPKKKAIAVLPFSNISPDKESDYFSDGLTDELITNLSRLKEIRVVPRTTSLQYKGTKKDNKTIGQELGVPHILAGSVRKFQDNLRITVELVDIASDTQMWADAYRGKLEDVFDFQEQVSHKIVDALMVKLTPTEKVVLSKRPTENSEAFDCYLRGREFLYRPTKSNIQIAIDLFKKATELDARYAAAYAGMGEAYAELYQHFDKKEAWLDKALEAGLKAQMYDSTLSEAYATLALVYFRMTDLGKGSLDDAFSAGQKAIDLDPNNHIAYWILGRIYHTTDRDQDAMNLYKKVIELSPDFYSAYGDLQVAYEKLGLMDKWHETLDAALEMYPRYLHLHPDDGRAHIYYAIDLTKAGRVDEAKSEAMKAIQLSPDDPLMLYNVSCFYSRLGERLSGVETLKKAISAGFENFEWIKRDTDFDNIRDEPDYIELMKGK